MYKYKYIYIYIYIYVNIYIYTYVADVARHQPEAGALVVLWCFGALVLWCLVLNPHRRPRYSKCLF